jgi:hypothetical protein
MRYPCTIAVTAPVHQLGVTSPAAWPAPSAAAAAADLTSLGQTGAMRPMSGGRRRRAPVSVGCSTRSTRPLAGRRGSGRQGRRTRASVQRRRALSARRLAIPHLHRQRIGARRRQHDELRWPPRKLGEPAPDPAEQQQQQMRPGADRECEPGPAPRGARQAAQVKRSWQAHPGGWPRGSAPAARRRP